MTMTVVIVTHNMQQATRVSDFTMFMLRESMAEPAHLVEVRHDRSKSFQARRQAN